VSLALLGSSHPLPTLQPVNLTIRDQTLLGKRKRKELSKRVKVEERVVDSPAKFEYKEEIKAP
jgi:hypothetical protein